MVTRLSAIYGEEGDYHVWLSYAQEWSFRALCVVSLIPVARDTRTRVFARDVLVLALLALRVVARYVYWTDTRTRETD